MSSVPNFVSLFFLSSKLIFIGKYIVFFWFLKATLQTQGIANCLWCFRGYKISLWVLKVCIYAYIYKESKHYMSSSVFYLSVLTAFQSPGPNLEGKFSRVRFLPSFSYFFSFSQVLFCPWCAAPFTIFIFKCQGGNLIYDKTYEYYRFWC